MDRFDVILQSKSAKFFKSCSPDLALQLGACFEQLEQNPFRGKDIKYLKSKDLYRYRIGGYRVIYDIDKNNKRVGILLIDKRGDVYKKI